MYSNRYVAIHCCKQKYLAEIMKKGIERASKAVFISDLRNINNEQLCNTLAVLVYHGIGVDGWNRTLNEGKSLNKIDSNLAIVFAKFSKEQEKIINNGEILNYYKIYKDCGRTMNYCKIKDIGKLEKVLLAKEIPLDNIKIVNTRKIDPIKERFFIKNIYNNLEKENNEVISDVEKFCYKIANENLLKVKESIFSISKL